MSRLWLCVSADGHRQWLGERDLLHRVEGPAIEGDDGTKKWLKRGFFHRPDRDAPTHEAPGQPIRLPRARRRARLDDGSNRRWRDEQGQLHREGGPAFEGRDGTKLWFSHGEFCQHDRPAEQRIPM